MTKLAFTDAAVKRLKPPKAGQEDVFDKGYPGLALRLSYGGKRSWVYFYSINGRLRRITLGAYPALSLADAREAWRKFGSKSYRISAAVLKCERLFLDQFLDLLMDFIDFFI